MEDSVEGGGEEGWWKPHFDARLRGRCDICIHSLPLPLTHHVLDLRIYSTFFGKNKCFILVFLCFCILCVQLSIETSAFLSPAFRREKEDIVIAVQKRALLRSELFATPDLDYHPPAHMIIIQFLHLLATMETIRCHCSFNGQMFTTIRPNTCE